MRCELHCHTRISDGYLSVVSTLRRAQKRGLSVIAITDHDTVKGISEANEAGEDLGLLVISGIELSAADAASGRRVHILGYFVDTGSVTLEEFTKPVRVRRDSVVREMLELVRAAGYPISVEKVEEKAQGGTGLYKQHIMHVIMDEGICKSIYAHPYRSLFGRGNADGVGRGLAYIAMEYPDARDAIRVVLEAGGVPVLAHPFNYMNMELIPGLVDAGLAGLEVYHPHHSPEAERACLDAAERHSLIVTGGSDAHGLYGDTAEDLGDKDPGGANLERLLVLHGMQIGKDR